MNSDHHQNLVTLDKATFHYKTAEAPALVDLNLVLPRGQLTAVLGPSDAGKSTFCLLLSGLVPHLITGELTGSVIVNGENSGELGQEGVATLTRHVGSVFQNPESQLFGLTVEEDIAFGPENLKVQPEVIRSTIGEVLHRVGLEGFEKRSPFRLSGGQKQRVAIAAALALRPELLVLDEPVSELDPIGKAEVLEIVRKLSLDEVTIVVADHEPEWVLEMADRVLILSNGRIARSGSPHEVFSEPDSLREFNVRIPPVVEITHRLSRAGLLPRVFTREQKAIEAISKAVKSGAITTGPEPSGPHAGIDASERIEQAPVAIEVKNLVFAYPDGPRVLDDVNLSIRENEFVALVGHNGSGKTTLAKHFNGIHTPVSGQVLLHGADIAEMGLSSAARRVGYVYQNPDHQTFARTVFDEVAFGPRNLGIKGDELKDTVNEALRFVGLEGSESKEPFFLGLGQRQRLAVASVLAMQPEVLVVDEPDTGQDERGAREMMTLIERLHATGRTIVMITHTMDLVARHAHRVIAMSGGQIVLDSSTRDFFSSSEVLEELSMRSPQVNRICRAVGSTSAILTLEEAMDWLQPQAAVTKEKMN